MTRLSDLVRPLIASTFVDKTNIEAIASPPLIKDVKDTPSENLNLPAAEKPSTVCADTTEMPILRIHADGSMDSEPEMEVEDDEVLFPQEPEEGEVPIQGEGPPCNLDHPLRQRVRRTEKSRSTAPTTYAQLSPWILLFSAGTIATIIVQ